MNHLSDQIKSLRGASSLMAFAEKVGLNRQTITELEQGKASVKLSTLKQIADKLNVPQEQWADLLMGWIRVEIGEENFSLIDVKTRRPLRKDSREENLCAMAFNCLTADDRRQIYKAMLRKSVREGIAALNQQFEAQKADLGEQIWRYAKSLNKTSPDQAAWLKELGLNLEAEGFLPHDKSRNTGLETILEHEFPQALLDLGQELFPEVIREEGISKGKKKNFPKK